MLTPASIRDAELPDGIGEEDLMAIGATPYMQPSIRPSYITFFAHAVKLCQLVGEVLDVVYGGGILTNDTTNSGTFAADSTRESSASSLIDKIKTGNTHDILRLDAELTKWRNELPSFLQIATYTTDPVCALTSPATENDPTLTEIPQELLIIFNRQAKVLQARYISIPRSADWLQLLNMGFFTVSFTLKFCCLDPSWRYFYRTAMLLLARTLPPTPFKSCYNRPCWRRFPNIASKQRRISRP